MEIVKFNKFVKNLFNSEHGVNTNLAALGATSLVSSFLFIAVTVDNIKDHERQAHYYNGVQMAQGVKFKLDKDVLNGTAANTVTELCNSMNVGFSDCELPTGLTFTLEKIGQNGMNLVRYNPDATASRLKNGEDVSYDLIKTKIKVVALENTVDDDENPVYAVIDQTAAGGRDKEFKRLTYQVNIIGKKVDDNSMVTAEPEPYIVMFESDALTVNDEIQKSLDGKGYLYDILAPSWALNEKTIVLP